MMVRFMQLFPLPSAKRAAVEEIHAQAEILDAIPPLQRILNALPTMALVLNRERQVVLANQRLIEFAGATGIDDLCGLRPGEVLRCIHAAETPAGCGSTEHCTVCGALQAIVTAQFGVAETQVCRVRRRTAAGEEPLELEISACPVEMGGSQFLIVCASDIGGRLRRESLENWVLPEAVELALEMEVLAATLSAPGMQPEGRQKVTARMAAASRGIATLMREHAELAAAESGALVVAPRTVSALEILRDTARELEYHPLADRRCIRIGSEDASVDTDPIRARRVIEKLLLNALEATPEGGTVTAGCRATERVEFRIHNQGEMPREVQLQVFQRSFSTKGRGRGYGTYYARLIAERYLKGTVSFQSSVAEGTSFALSVPG
jgi:signal transduction histidine kinase